MGDFVKERFDEINSMSQLGYEMFNEPFKPLAVPTEWNEYQNTRINLSTESEEEKAKVVEYFTRLGKLLSESQDNIYVNMKTGGYGITDLHITFSDIG